VYTQRPSLRRLQLPYTYPPPGGKPQGVAQGLGKAQNRGLQVVTGAYRATPTYTLETKA
jgi:hypothetical protein